jgi:hypothetical protein
MAGYPVMNTRGITPKIGGGDPNVDPMWDTNNYAGGSSTFDETGRSSDPNVDPTWGGIQAPTLPNDTTGQDWSWLDKMTQGSGGNGNPTDWGKYFGQIMGTDGNGSPRDTALLLASLGMAGKQWKDAGQYMDKTTEWAKGANPFGDQRAGYGQQLAALYADPSSLKNNPAYQFTLDAGMNALGPQQAAKGGGYGNQARTMVDYAQGAASKVWNDETNRLAHLAGADIGPEAAARLQMAGLDASVKSQNAALGSAMFPFGSGGMMGGNGPGQNNNRTGSGGNGGGNGSGGGTGVAGTNFSAAQVAQLAKASGMSPAQVLNQLKYMGNGPEAAQFIRDYGGYAANPMQTIQNPNPSYGEMNPGGFTPDMTGGGGEISGPDISMFGPDPSQYDFGVDGIDPSIFSII